jgi:tight adherence protein C
MWPPSRRRTQRAIDHAVPDLIELLVLAIEGGAPPFDAFTDIASLVPPPVRPVVHFVVVQVRSGARMADTLAEVPQHFGAAFAPLAESLAAAERYGLPLTPVLHRLADDARAARRRAAEARARELPVRLAAPLVLCTLPSFVLLAVVPLLLGALSSLQW